MCKFFSFITDGNGKDFVFFNADQRKLAIEGNLLDRNGNKIEYAQCDSHAAISNFYGLKEDSCNKYEYDPDADTFMVDQINAKNDDRAYAEAWAKGLSYSFIAKLKNSGDRNSGHWNSGNRNSGNRNSGNRNSGYGNSGDWNSGHWNSGDWNSGDWNSGDRNSGYGNSGYGNSGLFNSNTSHVRLFNKYSKRKWSDPVIQAILGMGPTNMCEWVCLSNMTKAELDANPKANVTDGFLRVKPYKQAWKEYWEKETDANKAKFLALPFFDAKVFEEITGIKVAQPKRKKS